MDGLSGGLLSLATFLMMNIPLNLDDKLAKKIFVDMCCLWQIWEVLVYL